MSPLLGSESLGAAPGGRQGFRTHGVSGVLPTARRGLWGQSSRLAWQRERLCSCFTARGVAMHPFAGAEGRED